MIYLLIWSVVLVAAVLLFFRQRYSTFRKHGIRHLKPYLLVGNTGRTLMKRMHFADDVKDLYNSFPEDRFVGRYDFLTELIVLRDIELIKQITVKDFEHFLDHRTTINENDILGRNLVSLKGQEWKDMRSTLSPAFTSSKIRLMVSFMVDVGDQMIRCLKKKIEGSNVGHLDVDCKDLTTRYANDVIASCAFGLKVDSHTEENNDFYVNGKKASTFSFRQIMMFVVAANFPKVAKFLKINLFGKSTSAFFRSLVFDTMRNREERKIIRPDMIHLLMEAKKGRLNHEEKSSEPVDTDDAGFAVVEESTVGTKKISRVWTDNDLLAQAVLFFLAGFETVSAGMSFLLFELAVNPEVQDHLAQEIKEYNAKNGGKFDFNSIQKMTYMDMVVSELLRMWPPGVLLDRLCIKDYNLGKPNKDAKEDFIIRKDSGIIIPVYPIHRDPKYYPNPNKFDPERFSEENKHMIQPFTYIPFGSGPRNCIGSRFALCEMKVITYQVLQHFVISPCEKTIIPAELSLENFNIQLKGGHWLRFKIRT